MANSFWPATGASIRAPKRRVVFAAIRGGRTAVESLLLGQSDCVCLAVQEAATSSTVPRVVFPGTFDPLHNGHREMANIAAQRLGSPAAFELSVFNVDKPPLDYAEIASRAEQFPDGQPIWLTRAATFVEKAALFPGATFIVGADTIDRIADPKYYDGSPRNLDFAIEQIAAAGCRFLVFGRVRDARFVNRDDLDLPSRLAALCDDVPERQFRDDISSTQLRRAARE